MSPDDRATDVHANVRDYLEAGTRQVWVLWPPQRSVTVYEPDGTAREFGPDTHLDGGTVLPEFGVPVGSLFEARRHR